MFLITALSQSQKKKFMMGYIAILLFAFNSCGNNREKEDMPEKPALSQIESLPQSPLEVAIPNLVTDETREIYQWYCSQCHGVKGKGDGINSKYVTVPPRNHTKPDYLETRSDQELFDAISFGGLQVGRAPCMPAWDHTLSREMIWSLVRYIRELCKCEEV